MRCINAFSLTGTATVEPTATLWVSSTKSTRAFCYHRLAPSPEERPRFPCLSPPALRVWDSILCLLSTPPRAPTPFMPQSPWVPPPDNFPVTLIPLLCVFLRLCCQGSSLLQASSVFRPHTMTTPMLSALSLRGTVPAHFLFPSLHPKAPLLSESPMLQTPVLDGVERRCQWGGLMEPDE